MVDGRKYLLKHKFNFVAYGVDPDYYIEPVNESDFFDDDTATPYGHEIPKVYIEGLELCGKPEATGFDDPRGL